MATPNSLRTVVSSLAAARESPPSSKKVLVTRCIGDLRMLDQISATLRSSSVSGALSTADTVSGVADRRRA